MKNYINNILSACFGFVFCTVLVSICTTPAAPISVESSSSCRDCVSQAEYDFLDKLYDRKHEHVLRLGRRILAMSALLEISLERVFNDPDVSDPTPGELVELIRPREYGFGVFYEEEITADQAREYGRSFVNSLEADGILSSEKAEQIRYALEESLHDSPAPYLQKILAGM